MESRISGKEMQDLFKNNIVGINTHEKLLKTFGGDILYNVLTLEGYAGSKDVAYKHLLDAITMTDSFISSSQSVDDPFKKISQEEYFDMLITEMNISLTYEHLYKEYVRDMFKERIFDKIMNNSDQEYNSREVEPSSIEEKATKAMGEFFKYFNPKEPREASILAKKLIDETIIKEQEDEWDLEI